MALESNTGTYPSPRARTFGFGLMARSSASCSSPLRGGAGMGGGGVAGGVGREGVVGLGDAHRQLAVAHRLELGELVAHRLVGGDVFRAIDLPGDGTDLVEQRHVVRIEQLELAIAAVD